MGMGARIAEVRQAKGWSTTKLASAADAIYRRQPGLAPQEGDYVTQQNISVMETRDSNKSEFVAAIAEALGVSLRWLITGLGRPDDADWPFPMVDRSRWDQLGEQQRGYVQGAINGALDEATPSAESRRSVVTGLLAPQPATPAGPTPRLPKPGHASAPASRSPPAASPPPPSRRNAALPMAGAKSTRKS
jgi:transcriptional regulator with XRE-family HTH domain